MNFEETILMDSTGRMVQIPFPWMEVTKYLEGKQDLDSMVEAVENELEKTMQIQLQEFKSESELEESNILMKLRETLLDETGEVTHPNMISFYPNHIFWFWFLVLGWLLFIIPVGGFLSELYD